MNRRLATMSNQELARRVNEVQRIKRQWARKSREKLVSEVLRRLRGEKE